MELIPFRPQDYSLLIDWINSEELNYLWGGPCYQFPLDFEQIAAHCQDVDTHAYILKNNHVSIGFIELIKMTKHHFRIARVFIHPNHRGLRFGHRMLEMVCQRAKQQHNAKHLTLRVFSKNKAALACYYSLGFKPFSSHLNVRQYKDQIWDLIEMELML
ncbi:GNAT family N-acetyltransferase [Vibrio sinensis]|uniref:GNAT family N-acetyltransferase n=1 Tax=Vibrio sinensis TaxID=2302434 RepID=UPI001401CD35|nr:GNAT family N-acetyltransferase [Vibrio sinensis]